MKSKKILISGYYGFDNFGDEAILYALVSEIKKNINNSKITAISNNPDKTSKNHNINSIYKFDFKKNFYEMKNADLFISGGGSLLQDVTSFKSLLYYLSLIFLAKILNKKIYIYAQGIGPVKSKLGRILTGFTLKKVDLITVRDKESSDFLKVLGVKNSIITTDSAWGIDKNIKHKEKFIITKEKLNIGIQLRDWCLLTEEKLKNLAYSLNKNLKDLNFQLILISLQDSKDLDILRNLEKILKSLNPDLDIQLIAGQSIFKNISLISQLDYLVAMRYHAILISIKYSIPVFCISYDPKTENLSKEAEILHTLANEMNEKELTSKIQKLIAKDYNYKDKLRDFSSKKERKSRQNIDLLIKIINEQSNSKKRLKNWTK
ncbi:MAG: polysaccharide pyruvyl transferase CsaB [bacterium]